MSNYAYTSHFLTRIDEEDEKLFGRIEILFTRNDADQNSKETSTHSPEF
tara:strand:+ start:3781 stop:3927 length:147 start_codon:yes stop_codon:yes gene_type:complete